MIVSRVIVLIYAVLIFIFSALLMWLWNITITKLFNIREITLWEAFRLIIIAWIILGKGLELTAQFLFSLL